MRRWLSSLTNRIFLSTALLTVLVLGAAIFVVNVVLTSRAERDLHRELTEASVWVEHYRTILVNNLAQQARLIADLPKLKAAVETNHGPTVQAVATDYRLQISADVLVVLGAGGDLLASDGDLPPDLLSQVAKAPSDGATPILWPRADSLLQIIVVPIWIDPSAPEVLGHLAVGAALDSELAGRIKSFTDVDLAFVADGRVLASTLPPSGFPALVTWQAASRPGQPNADVSINGEDFVSEIRPLPGSGVHAPAAVVLRSRTEHRRLLQTLQAALAGTGLVAILLATVLGYAVSRSITGPLGAITAGVREMAATGDLTRRIILPKGRLLVDEDAHVLASTLDNMTTSIARFQRDAAQRERLSSLGRLSTVIAHEIRNPLMIIKAALRAIRREETPPDRIRQAAADINEEVDRLNRLVDDVLDFARPLRFEYAPASLSEICRATAAATFEDLSALGCQVLLDPEADVIVTDAERLRQVLLNLLLNARHAILSARPQEALSVAAVEATVVPFRREKPAATEPMLVQVATCALEGDRVRIIVRDRGTGIAADDLPRIFEPYFTTRRTGSGLGLAITRNIVDGLGGTITFESEQGVGTEVHVDLPRESRASATPARPA